MNLFGINSKGLLQTVTVSALVVSLTSCSSQVLKQDKAQKLVNKFVSSNGSATIVGGVVQNEGASVAEARIDISGYKYRDNSYTGPGVASFTRYDDGSWALTKFMVTPPNSILGTTWWDVNIKE